jgi:pimeloyl-ACP methyl ester carboxylesterase
MQRLAGRFRVIAVDLYGSGKTVKWPHDEPMLLDDEVALLQPVFLGAGDRFHLVGHSYGGAIALKTALTYQDRLVSLVLYEPVLFSVLMANAPQSDAAHEIVALRDDTIRLVEQGDFHASAKRFVDYWTGDGAWATIPESRRPGMAETIRTLKPEWHALFQEPTPLEAFAQMNIPTLLLTGSHSKPPAQAVAQLLAKVLPQVSRQEIQGAGHMAPVSQPELINPFIERFLEAAQRPVAGDAPNSARA